MSLSLRAISKRFGNTQALDEVSIDFAAGEVHALLGENGAGKSTLMNIAYGLLQPDAGRIIVGDRPLSFRSPVEARRAGIGMVHQEFSLIDNLPVSENLILALGDCSATRIDRTAVRTIARELAEKTGLDLADLDARTGDLAVGARQRIEILKALAGDTRVLILDEPTAVLTPAEADQLFTVLDRLRNAGTAIVFITHKLAEVMAVADRVSVMRQGRLIATRARNDVTHDELADLMVRRDDVSAVSERGDASAPAHRGAAQRVRLQVSDLTVREGSRPALLDGVSLEVAEGEVFAIAGVDGNGQAELFEALVGERRCSSGRVLVDGEDLTSAAVRTRLRAGMSWIPPDRQRQGLIRAMSVRENVLLHEAVLDRARSGPFLSVERSRRFASGLVREYDVRCAGIEAAAGSLSGGNQQRLIVGRSLASDPAVLIAFNPTRGLDIGASAAVYSAFRAAAKKGTAILMLSTDLDEVLDLGDRVAVLYRGRLSPPLGRPASIEQVGRWMTGAA